MPNPPHEPVAKRWNRGSVRSHLEEASGVALSVADALPDTLIAQAQELGLLPADLEWWIDSRPDAWTTDALARWAREWRVGEPAEGFR